MVQRLKDEVRREVVSAATTLFAEAGYEATSIADVAARAGISTGNVYRYFESKDALFAAAVPSDFGRELAARTRARIEALGDVRDVGFLASDARYHVLAGELLDFTITHRERVVVLLLRARGTSHERFVTDFRNELVELALAYVRRAWPEVPLTKMLRFTLDRAYAAFLESAGLALASFREPPSIRSAVHQLTAYHQGGLKRLFETLDDAARNPAHAAGSAVPPNPSRDARDSNPKTRTGARR